MSSLQKKFLQHVAQTSNHPIGIEVERAEGIYIYDTTGKKHIDMIAGVAVSNVGHGHPKVIEAVKTQVEKYMHLMVYGEFVQAPQVALSEQLASVMPKKLQSVYLVNSGSEANEGAVKLAKRHTNRSEVVAFKNAYHGSTHGALSITGCEWLKQAYRPLVPDICFLEFNNTNDLQLITNKTACVIIEPVQGEAGIIPAQKTFMQKLRERCNETGTLLIFDEIQTGFGRTGSLFAFEQYQIVPDIITLAKALGGGMPLGAFVASNQIMESLKTKPILGHITTFGGHPVCCAAASAALQIVIEEKLAEKALKNGILFEEKLKHPKIKEVRGLGMMYAVELQSRELMQKYYPKLLENGLITETFLFDEKSFRISPPLIIKTEEIEDICQRILNVLH